MFRFRTKAKKEELVKRVAELETQVYELETNLIHDPLTGLKTRAFFEEEVGTYLEVITKQDDTSQYGPSRRKERFGFRNLSIIFFDIDRFKIVNDKYGHDIGDLVLKRVAEVIQASLRTGDTAARWGGEEIVVSLLGANEKDAAVKAEEIRRNIEKLKFSKAKELSLSISAGVASSQKGIDLLSLIKRADQALYHAKESGRNKVQSYSELKNGDSK